jgi:hypothetical protein
MVHPVRFPIAPAMSRAALSAARTQQAAAVTMRGIPTCDSVGALPPLTR